MQTKTSHERSCPKRGVKLLDAGTIYPIFDNKWVSAVQVVPKISNMTMIKKNEGKLIPTRHTMD